MHCCMRKQITLLTLLLLVRRTTVRRRPRTSLDSCDRAADGADADKRGRQNVCVRTSLAEAPLTDAAFTLRCRLVDVEDMFKTSCGLDELTP